MIPDGLDAILVSRQNRVRTVQALLRQYSFPVVVLGLNIPGIDKNPSWAEMWHEEGIKRFTSLMGKQELSLRLSIKRFVPSGWEWFGVVDFYPEELKTWCMTLEESLPAGRLWDFDVHKLSGGTVDRASLGALPRGCFICDKPGHLCSRNGTHDPAELASVIRNLINGLYKEPMSKIRD